MKKLFDKIMSYVKVDGLLHFLVSYALMLTFSIINILVGFIVTIWLCGIKEMYDLAYKGNDAKDSIHDIVCDVAGLALALIIVLIFL